MKRDSTVERVLVTGATGFIGRALVPALVRHGYTVRGASRHPPPRDTDDDRVEWAPVDLLSDEPLGAAFAGIDCAYYLVHSMGSGHRDFRERDRRAAHAFVSAAERAGVKRIVYLGGIAPTGHPSAHLASRLEVGEILRASSVPTVELRASMIIGHGSASWRIVRDLAKRLPAMVFPAWLESRTRPVALEDVVEGLISAATLPIHASVWFDLPGPEVMSGREILMRIARIEGRRIPALPVPFLSPRLSSLWLRLVTGADYSLARELVLGFEHDLVSNDERFWDLTRHGPLVPFDTAARRALAEESPPHSGRERIGHILEQWVSRVGPAAAK